MTIPQGVESLPNFLRLQSLKNVSGRRKVLPGAQFLQDLENYESDVEGTSQPLPNFANLPQPESGGELTSQSYDVRANSAVPPEAQETAPQEPESFWHRFGKALALQTHNVPKQTLQPPVETMQVEQQEGLPNTPPPEAQALETPNSYLWNSIGSALKEYIQPFKTEEHWEGKISPENQNLIENAQLRSQGKVPEEYRAEQEQIKANTQSALKEETEKALENPWTTTVYGSTDVVANQSELQAEFNKITGMDFNPEIERQTKEYEKVLTDIDKQINMEGAGYNEQEQRIKDRILANQSNDADKFYIGVALLMPLLVGALFGKEAALGALGGGAKGISDVYARRSKENMENEELLSDIAMNKGNVALKKSELDLKRLAIPSEIRKNLPKDEKEFLKDKREAVWTDPKTGERKVGIEVKPNLIALPEFVTDKDELKEMRKEAGEISSAIIPTKEINKLTGEIIDIASKMKDKNLLGQAFSSYISGKDPGLASKLGEKVEFNGRMVNSYVVLEHKLKLLVDAYRQAKGMRALTSTVQEHIDGLFRNPTASFQSYQDTIDQMLYTRDLAQSRLLNTVSSSGFVPEFVAKDLQPDVRKTFNALNYNEGEKESADLLRE